MSKHPLAGFGNLDQDARQAKDEILHEEKVVKALLTAYKVTASSVKNDIVQWVKDHTNATHMTLIAWHKVMAIKDDIFIQSAVVDKFRDCTIDKLMRKFETRRVVQHYFERRENRPEEYDGSIFALVVDCAYVRIGLVVHDAPGSVFQGPRFTTPTKHGVNVTIETFDQFLQTQLHVR